jgi:hypothetical protein
LIKPKLHIDQLKSHFQGLKSFETKSILGFYQQFEPLIKPATVNWRVYSLIELGVLSRIGRGIFTLNQQKNYIPEVSTKVKFLYHKLVKRFPYLTICIWHTSILNEFMHHQPGKFFYLIEVEREATESAFYFLQEAKYKVFVEPTRDIFNKYIANESEAIIIKPLVSEAPTQQVENINTITLEKLLVDIYCDKIVFSAQQGAELYTILREAFSKYSINENRLLRYARRRNKNFKNYLKKISNFRQ